MIKKLKSFKRLLEEQRKIKKQVLKYREYLKPGFYRVNTIEKYKKMAFLRDEKTNEFIRKNKQHLKHEKERIGFIIGSFLHTFFNLFFTIRVTIECQKTKGTLLMITVDEEIKIFDFEENRLYTFFLNEKKYTKIKNTYLEFKDFFLIPFLNFKYEKLLLIEKYIDYTPMLQQTQKDKEFILKYIFNRYINYFNEIKKDEKQYIYIRDIINNFKNHFSLNKKQIEVITNYIPKTFLNERFPLIKMHGDLWSANILYNFNKIYMIDWEHSNYFICFYDLMYIILFDFIYDKGELIKSYIEGNFDEIFKKIFEIFGLKYDCNERKKYIYITYINMRLYFYEKFDTEQIKRILNEHISFIQEIEKL